MAIRGVYNISEKELLENWKMTHEAKCSSAQTPSLLHPVVSKELILNNAKGMNDRNPLWTDEIYAKNTRWGGIIAPPLFPYVICGGGPSIQLKMPPNWGSLTNVPAGTKWKFNKPIYEGDSFRIKDGISFSIEDITRLDGKGSHTFLVSSGREFINQRDETVCVFFSKRLVMITPPGQDKEPQPIVPLLNMDAYKYVKEELEFIDQIYHEEEIRGSSPRYWDDINEGDEIKPVVVGPITIWDQIFDFVSRGLVISNTKELQQKTPQALIVDPNTNVSHYYLELHFVDHIAQLMGGNIAVISRGIIEQSMCRAVTNWAGDDGFVRLFDSNDWTIIPIGDTFICKGKVVNKRVENDEHLVDIRVWAEDIRGYLAATSMVTVSLFS